MFGKHSLGLDRKKLSNYLRHAAVTAGCGLFLLLFRPAAEVLHPIGLVFGLCVAGAGDAGFGVVGIHDVFAVGGALEPEAGGFFGGVCAAEDVFADGAVGVVGVRDALFHAAAVAALVTEAVAAGHFLRVCGCRLSQLRVPLQGWGGGMEAAATVCAVGADVVDKGEQALRGVFMRGVVRGGGCGQEDEGCGQGAAGVHVGSFRPSENGLRGFFVLRPSEKGFSDGLFV